MLTLSLTEMPACLTVIPDPPEVLHVSGPLVELLQRPRLAVVGSRKATAYGKSVTMTLVYDLIRAGVVIVSGLAYGIDSIAHSACLEAGGQTIAVLPSDLKHIYPASHARLAASITTQGGALVSEYPDNTIPFASNFLERNRLIAGLSDAVLITEAAVRSGSLNTARHALDQGKTVFAVPGNITSPLSTGCNNLIKAGAFPVQSAQDILDLMRWEPAADKPKTMARNREEHIILELLSSGVSDGSELLHKSKLPTAIFNQTLTMLELTGAITALGGNQWMAA